MAQTHPDALPLSVRNHCIEGCDHSPASSGVTYGSLQNHYGKNAVFRKCAESLGQGWQGVVDGLRHSPAGGVVRQVN